jgi:hypothetical protein
MSISNVVPALEKIAELEIQSSVSINGVIGKSISTAISTACETDGTIYNFVLTQQALFVPIGTLNQFFGNESPNEFWLLCDGSSYSITDYPDLNDHLMALGLASGVLPDLTGLFARSIGARDPDHPRTVGSVQMDEFRAHAHNYTTKAADLPQTGFTTNCWSGNATAQTSFTGGSETRPINFAMNYLIKAM